MNRRAQPLSAFLAAAAAVLLLIPSARGNAGAVTWNSTTPTSGTRYAVPVGSFVSFALSASASTGAHIHAVGALPAGARLAATDGTTARATFRWSPKRTGSYRLELTASTASGATAPTLAYAIDVKQAYPRTSTLTTRKIAHWAVVTRRAAVRTQPSLAARPFTTLSSRTSDGTQNVVLVLAGIDVRPQQTWYRVRLPILPNNSTGWVRKSDLGDLYTVRTHLYVDRRAMTARLTRDGVTVFTTNVGIGRSQWPTPAGEFYVRDKLTDFGNPFYGPVAFGTSARSTTLTDWPGGGFVGVHGTNQPGILPGRVSHGCIRMRNAAILKLERLMPVGTPLTVT